MKKFLVCSIGVAVCVVLALGLFGNPVTASAAEPIELRAVVPTPVFIPIVAPVKNMYIPGIEKASGGRLKIKLMGGPEVIPAESQVDAVSKGIIDMAFQWVSDYRHLVPVSGAMHLTPYAPWEEREKGVFDYWVKAHKKINIQYIGRWAWGMRFIFNLRNKEIKTLSDFKGIKMDDPIYIHSIPKAFGMVPLEISGPDIFTAMERGVIDGYIWGDFGRYPGWEKVTKYVLEDPFLQMDMVILINQDAYNKIPQDLKDTLEKFTMRYEREVTDWYQEQVGKEKEKYIKAGTKFIRLPPNEAKYLEETALKLAWEEDVKATVSPQEYREVKALLTK